MCKKIQTPLQQTALQSVGLTNLVMVLLKWFYIPRKDEFLDNKIILKNFPSIIRKGNGRRQT